MNQRAQLNSLFTVLKIGLLAALLAAGSNALACKDREALALAKSLHKSDQGEFYNGCSYVKRSLPTIIISCRTKGGKSDFRYLFGSDKGKCARTN